MANHSEHVERGAPDAEPGGIRLQKVMADAGVASRRKAEEMITAGRVTVNGRVVRELGTRVNPSRDHVKVDGRHLKPVPPHVYIMLHKPKGVVSSLEDPEGRPTITDLLRGIRLRVFPVGRLDYDTEGVLLLTNHGEMAEALLHPRYHVPKTYLVKVKGVLTDDDIEALERGVTLEDGPTGPAKVQKMKKAEQNSWIELTIHEGRKHQVKRMIEAVGHVVLKLKRVRFGPLTLGGLEAGEYRFLTDREANALRDLLRTKSEREGHDAPRRGAQLGERSEPAVGRPRPARATARPRTRSSHPAPGRRSARRREPRVPNVPQRRRRRTS